MRVMRGFRQNIFNDATRQFLTALILFQNNINFKPGPYVFLIFHKEEILALLECGGPAPLWPVLVITQLRIELCRRLSDLAPGRSWRTQAKALPGQRTPN